MTGTPGKEAAQRRGMTLHLDDETERRLRRAAVDAGMSPSQWVGDLIRQATRDEGPQDEWPDSVRRLAGAWSDFPSVEEIRDEGRRRQ